MGLDPLLGSTALTPPPQSTMLEDGGALVDFGGPQVHAEGSGEHYANLAEQLSDADLGYICDQLIQDIDEDNASRSDWVALYTKALDLLGLRIEEAATGGADGVSRSTVRSPILLDACVRYQAESRGELLPADGPAKVAISGKATDQERDEADDLEDRYNHYLTVTATEYYPDFDRMTFHQAFAGCVFRKIYRDPLRGRPVSESVYGPDLIVSQDITDLDNASRVTHRIDLRQSLMKRLQLLGVYRDIPLQTPQPSPDPAKEKQRQIVGVSASLLSLEQKPHEVLECYTELDLPGFEHKNEKHEKTGLPLPYQVTIEKTSRAILAIRRNWRESDKRYRAVQRFVKYPFIPALGFYDVGFAHLLGNSARTLTAIWRLLIDAGMFANFPGWLFRKGAKFSSNNFQVGPGEGKEVDTGDDPLTDVVMPVPYKDPSGVLATFAEKIEQGARELGGNGNLPIGEGRQDAPVGTTLALLERAVKIMGAVHKRTHAAQGIELRLLQELFAEDPTPLLYGTETPEQIDALKAALRNRKIVPASDPNVPSHMQRIMRAVAIMQMAAQFPDKIDGDWAIKQAWRAIGIADDEGLIPPEQRQQGGGEDPKVTAAKIKAQSDQTRGQQQSAKLQSDMMLQSMREKHDLRESADQAADRASREGIARTNAFVGLMKLGSDRTLQREHAALADREMKAKAASDKEHTKQAELKVTAAKHAAAKAAKRKGFADGGRVVLEENEDLIVETLDGGVEIYIDETEH